jgi:hypothetical protein
MVAATTKMTETRSISDPSRIPVAPARLAIAAAAAEVLFLAGLHLLSPEFDPSWRVVSEYATGQYGWVLSLMFLTGALSVWALAFAIRSQVGTMAGKFGLGLLIASGIGAGMAVAFDINHPLHGLAGLIGVLCFPPAAMLISVSLGRTHPWSTAKRSLLWTANLTWISLGLFVVALIALFVTFTQTGGQVSNEVTELPSGVIAVVGYANRLVVVIGCVWTANVAAQGLKLRGRESSLPSQGTAAARP